MLYSRRKFIQTGSMLTAAGILSANKLMAGTNGGINNFGLQLWTLRDVINENPKDTLKQVASFGYKQIESFEGKQGIFWGMNAGNFKKYMDDLGMKIVSAHCDINKDFEKKAADAASIGMNYLICPYKGPQKSIEDFKKFADEFNAKGEICRKNGIRFAYHNHDYSFKAVDGQIPQDVMMDNTDKNLVDFEMDIYWVVTAGASPEAYFKKYENRFRLCHVKDREKNAVAGEGEASCIVGQGSIDYPTILHTAKKCGMEYFIVEQEKYANTTPLLSAEADAAYLKTIRI